MRSQRVGPICPDAPEGSGTFVLGFTKDADGSGHKPRLAGACQGTHCQHWRDNGCAKLCDALAQLEKATPPTQLPRCDIQQECLWYERQGATACIGCQAVRWV